MQRTLDLTYDEIIIGADLSALLFSLQNNIPIIFIRLSKPPIYDFELSKQKDYIKLINELALKNLLPFSNLVVSMRLDNNKLKAITKNNLIINISYKTLYLSDDYNLEGLPPPSYKSSTLLLVNDYFKTKKKITKQILETDSNFVKKIYIDKNIVSLSLIDESSINDFESSQNLARLKLQNILKVSLYSLDRVCYNIGKNIYENLPSNIKCIK